eukprot:3033090-Amphidinium_carterae.1
MLTDSVPLVSSSTAIPEDSSVLSLSVLSVVPGPPTGSKYRLVGGALSLSCCSLAKPVPPVGSSTALPEDSTLLSFSLSFGLIPPRG